MSNPGLLVTLLGSASRAALSLDFTTGSLDSRITFSRPSLATMYDSTGKLTYAPNNLLLRSQEIDNASWTKGSTSITADAVAAPDGTTTADFVKESASGSANRFVYNGYTGAAGTRYVLSIYAKMNGVRYLHVRDDSESNKWTWVSFDLQAGAVIGNSGVNYVASSISSVGSGWYRCTVVFTQVTAGSRNAVFSLNSASTAPLTATTTGDAYTGTGNDGIYLWGAQLEAVTYQTTPSTYVATTSAAYYGPRFDYNPSTLAARGLLIEEARTNTLTYSNTLSNAAWTKGNGAITQDATVSPDGTANAWKFTASATNSYHIYYQLITASAGATVSYSAFVKADTAPYVYLNINVTPTDYVSAVFNLSTGVMSQSGVGTTGTLVSTSIQSIGNNWYRISMVASTAGANPTPGVGIAGAATGNTISNYGLIYFSAAGTEAFYSFGVQAEIGGSFATSYIPTGSSSVARSADSASMTGSNFSSWYNDAEGTFMVQYDKASFATAMTAMTLGGGSGSAAIIGGYNQAGVTNDRWYIRDSAAAGLNNIATNTTPSVNVSVKTAGAYKANDYAIAADNTTPVTSTAGGATGSFSSLTLGSSFDGHIQTLTYYRTRLSNTRLQALTQ